MSRNGITQDQVFAAAQDLITAQQPVTVHAVREILGQGSFSTIAQHLRTFRSQTKESALPPAPLPPLVATTANRAIAAIWQAAQELAHREIEIIRQLAQAQLVDAQGQAEEAVQEVMRLEKQIQACTLAIADKTQQIEALNQALTQCENQIAAHLARNEQTSLRLTELRAELAEARAATEQKTEECGRLRGELAARTVAPTPEKARTATRVPPAQA